MTDRPARIAFVLKRPSAAEAARAQIEAQCMEGAAVHLAFQDLSGDRAALIELCARHPSISVGYAIPRRDRWSALARDLAQGQRRPDMDEDEQDEAPAAGAQKMRAALPPDAGVLAYLEELDLDRLILTDLDSADSVQFDYLLACRRLRLPAQLMLIDAADTEDPAAAAGPPSPLEPPRASLSGQAALWATRIGELFGGGDGLGSRRGLVTRLQDAYVSQLFPKLISFCMGLLPGSHPVLDELSKQLNPSKLSELMSIETDMAMACRGSGPIIFGPWTGDIDSEILYWVPFLRWYRKRYHIDRERIIVVSRGDTRTWYEGVGGRYIDVAELYSPEETAELDQQRSDELNRRKKQYGFTDADKAICRKVSKRLSAAGLNVLHPRTMQVLFERYFSDVGGHAFISSYTRYQKVNIKPAKVRQLCPDLPDRYVAVNFQFQDSFPDTEENRAFAVAALRRIAERNDVVLVGSGAALKWNDLLKSPRIHRIKHDPRRALGIHTAIIAGADAFVGGYDGLAYVAANLGKTVIAFESRPGPHQFAHKAVAARELAFDGAGVNVLRTTEIGRLDWLLDVEASSARARRPAEGVAAP